MWITGIKVLYSQWDRHHQFRCALATDRSRWQVKCSNITKVTFLKSSWVTSIVPSRAHILWSCSGKRNPKKLFSACHWHAQCVIQLCPPIHLCDTDSNPVPTCFGYGQCSDGLVIGERQRRRTKKSVIASELGEPQKYEVTKAVY